jgi:hypothetical protein
LKRKKMICLLERKLMFVGEWRLLDAREGPRNVAEDERLRTMSDEEL